jgi:hypothetical protein
MGDSPFQIQTRPQAIAYATEEVQPPSALAITTNDQLVIDVMSDAAATQGNVFARVLLPDSTIVPMQWGFTTANQYDVETFSFPLADGFLLSLVISSVSTTTQRGELFARVRVFRGSLTQNFPGLQLTTGYITALTPLSWPDGVRGYSYEGFGHSLEVVFPAVGAGVEISLTMPTGSLRHVYTGVLTLVTSATVANRTSGVQVTDGSGRIVYATTANLAQVAGTTKLYIFSYAPTTGGAAGNNIQMPWPNRLPIQPGWTISSNTVNLQAGDQYTGLLYCEEFLQP